MNLLDEIEKIKQDGYSEANAEAKLCQDIIIKAISQSSLNRNVTIKGGVVMRSLSRTQDVLRRTWIWILLGLRLESGFYNMKLYKVHIKASVYIHKFACYSNIKVDRTKFSKILFGFFEICITDMYHERDTYLLHFPGKSKNNR